MSLKVSDLSYYPLQPQLDGASSHGGIVCPTLIRPHFHCSDNSPAKALHKRASLKVCMYHKSVCKMVSAEVSQTGYHVGHPSSQRSSPGGASPQRKSKRPPLPVFGSSNSNSSPPKKSLKVCTPCLQEWSWLYEKCFTL